MVKSRRTRAAISWQSAIAFLLLWAGSAHASLVQINFTGYFLQSHGSLFNANDTFSGSYIYESTVAGIDHPDASLDFQYLAINSPSPPGTGWSMNVYSTTSVGTFAVAGNVGVLALGNNTSFGDRYVATLQGNPQISLPLGFKLNFLQFDLADSLGGGADMLAGSQLSALPNFALAGAKGGRFFLTTNDGSCQQCQLAITSLAPVPLPAAAWLLLSGIGGLAAVAKRNRAS